MIDQVLNNHVFDKEIGTLERRLQTHHYLQTRCSDAAGELEEEIEQLDQQLSDLLLRKAIVETEVMALLHRQAA